MIKYAVNAFIGFNPLFIGAWVRTWETAMSQGTLRGGFNPLFIGAWVRTKRPGGLAGWRRSFQSPLHRGLGSDDAEEM